MPSSRFLPVQSQAREVITHAGAQIDRAMSWHAFVIETLASASLLSIMITTPATGEYELQIDIEADKNGSWTWSEAPNATGGTVLTSFNHNRATGSDGTLTITSDPTIASTGTILDAGPIGTAGNAASIQGGDLESGKWILNQSTKYLASFTSGAATTAAVLRVDYDESR